MLKKMTTLQLSEKPKAIEIKVSMDQSSSGRLRAASKRIDNWGRQILKKFFKMQYRKIRIIKYERG